MDLHDVVEEDGIVGLITAALKFKAILNYGNRRGFQDFGPDFEVCADVLEPKSVGGRKTFVNENIRFKRSDVDYATEIGLWPQGQRVSNRAFVGEQSR